MYNIYFNKRVLNICNSENLQLKNPNSVIFNSSSPEDIAGLPAMFDKSENIQNIIIPVEASEVETTFQTICSTFTQINAAGGLVENENGEYLLIHRNGLWDLPKGKQEEGEDIAVTAQREVEEECGINGLELKDLICITRHTYHMNGQFVLKHTYWYNMKYSGDSSVLTPQLDEGIQQCRWVPASELPELLKDTYPSIRQVFEEAGLL